MELTFLHFLIICPLVFLAGFVDAVAGGGGLISLPAYLITGLPAHTAIATNKLSACMGTTVATAKYAKSGFIPWKTALFCIAFAFAGSFTGAKLALMLSDKYFKIFILIVLPITAFYVLRKKTFTSEKPPLPYKKTVVLACAISLLIGIYDGFYGPGTGTFLILLFTAIAHMDIKNANGLTKVINLSTNISAAVVFLTSGVVIIPLGLTAGLFGIAGNYLGASCFEKKGVKSVRLIMPIVLVLFFIKVIVEMF